MRKFILLALFAAGITAGAWFTSCNNKKSGTQAAGGQDSATAMLERGSYLANNVAGCIDCHSIRDTGRFSMPVVPGTEGSGAAFAYDKSLGFPGELTAPNITPFATKDWTDEDWIKAITKGINKKGDTLFPIMPFHNYSKMAKSDLFSIIAYIKTIKPVERSTPARKLEIPLSALPPLPDVNPDQNTIPDTKDPVKYGEYLVTMAGCADCHTPAGPQGPDFSKAFAGGTVTDIPILKVAVANITPDTATGIGAWTEAKFLETFRANASDEKLNTKPGRFNTYMPWSFYGKMKEDDLKAIYAYLRTVKPVSNKVERFSN